MCLSRGISLILPKKGRENEGVMDDESGESMKLMEEVPLRELGDAELERLVRG